MKYVPGPRRRALLVDDDGATIAELVVPFPNNVTATCEHICHNYNQGLEVAASELTDQQIIDIRRGPRFARVGSLEPWSESIAFARAVIAATRGVTTP